MGGDAETSRFLGVPEIQCFSWLVSVLLVHFRSGLKVVLKFLGCPLDISSVAMP